MPNFIFLIFILFFRYLNLVFFEFSDEPEARNPAFAEQKLPPTRQSLPFAGRKDTAPGKDHKGSRNSEL